MTDVETTISGVEDIDRDYQAMLDECKDVNAVMPKQIYEYIRGVDRKTKSRLSDLWADNIKANCKHFIPECGWLNNGFVGVGRNKATIAIGSGRSLKHNEKILRSIVMADSVLPYEKQAYLTMAANHQIKPCLEDNIIPNFAMLVDGGVHLKPQLDVGSDAKGTILIAGVTANPECLSVWPGPIKFVIQRGNEEAKRLVEESLGCTIEDNFCVPPGGNILNLSFMVTVSLFRGSIWMCVGNDLSYPAIDDAEERRAACYADGDYSSNKESGRDEAGRKLAWAGVKFLNDHIIIQNPDAYVDLELVYTAPQYVVYKSWLEAQALLLWEMGANFKVYNCTEGGILGVLLKEEAQDPTNVDAKFEKDSWQLMDDIARGNWRTRRLEKAHYEFMHARHIVEQSRKGVHLL